MRPSESAVAKWTRKKAELRKSQEREIEKLKSAHKKHVENLRSEERAQIFQIKSQNSQKLAQEWDNKQKKLDSFKQDFQRFEEYLDRQKDILKQGHGQQIDNSKREHAEHLRDISYKGEEQALDLRHQIDQKVEQLESKSEVELDSLRRDTASKLGRMTQKSQIKLDTTRSQNKEEVGHLKFKQDVQKKQMELEHKKFLERQAERHNRQYDLHRKTYQDALENQQKLQQSSIDGRKQDFSKNYAQLTQKHKETLDNMNVHFNKKWRDINLSIAKKLQLKEQQINDQFYHINRLEPRIEDKGDHYLVSLPVPQHEKGNFVLSGDKRTLRLSMARRFQDQVRDKQGGLHRTGRSESFTKEFQVPDLINSHGISHKWDGGELFYKVPKA